MAERRSFERRGNVIALQGREARLRSAAGVAGFGIYDLDCSSGEVRWSPELKAIAGVPAGYEPTALEQIADFVHPDDLARFLGKLRASLEPQGSGEFEDVFRLRQPGGNVRWVKAKGWTLFAGDKDQRCPLGAIGIVVDRAVEQAARLYGGAQSRPPGCPEDQPPPEADAAGMLLREQQMRQVELERQNEALRQARHETEGALQRYVELYDSAPVGYFTLGRDGSIRRLNLEAATLLGSERARVVGKRFGLYVEEGDRAAFDAFVARVLAGPGRSSASCEIVLVDPENRQRRRVVQIAAKGDGSGDAINAVAVDITEKRRATDELIRSNLELQQFAYIAAHDLQTPLRSISGFVRLLQQEFGAYHDERADTWVAHVVRHVQRMQSLIQDLLVYSRLDSPSRPVEPTDFNELFDEVVDALDAMIGESGASVTRDRLPTVVCNRIQLAQVLQNLIDNGIKYRSDVPPRVHVSARRQDGAWVFSVRDNGIGIEAKHHRHVFEIFSRLHSQQAYPGTGIGLAICQRVIRRHGGRIWLESESGQGCTFLFSLPDQRGM